MAASAFSPRSPSRTSIAANLYHHDPAPATQHHPSGPCGYKELGQGHTCGCLRFSLNPRSSGHVGTTFSEAFAGQDLCYCGHHPCFHAWQERAGEQRTTVEKNAYGRDPSYDGSISVMPSTEAQQRHGFPARTPGSVAAAVGLSQTTNSRLPISASHSEHPRFNPFRPSPDELPSTQSSFKLPVGILSHVQRQPGASPSRRFMTQLSHSRLQPHLGLPGALADSQAVDAVRSPTELATPTGSMIGSPEVRVADAAFQSVAVGLEQYHSCLNDQRHTSQLSDRSKTNSERKSSQADGTIDAPTLNERLLTQVTSLRAILLSIPNFSTSLAGLAQRLDALESMSFSHVPVEELQERYDHFDGRLLDVEGRLEELERLCDSTSHGSIDSQNLAHVDDVRLSIEGAQHEETSGFVTGSVHAPVVQQGNDPLTTTRLEQLERRLCRFEASAFPSHTNPWEIEVVLLPWGRGLKGLWCTIAEFSQMSAPSSAGSRSVSANPSGNSSPGWQPNEIEKSLSARACGPTKGIYGRVYDRLRSRGFVRNVTITVNTAREVAFEVMWALEEQLRALKDERPSSTPRQQAPNGPLAFSHPFIPLRKVHKSSRLQFLTPAELATPSLWTAEFLNASVLMKAPVAGKRRLFITHPAAYLQSEDTRGDWTWQRLRELPRAKSDGDGGTIDDMDALEACWAADPRLDPPASAQTSFSSSSGSAFGSSIASPPPSPQQPTRQLPRHQNPLGIAPPGVQTVLETREKPHPITPVSQYQHSASQSLSLRRTSSVPIATTEVSVPSSSASKRQAASFDDVYIHIADEDTPSTTKRRRLSKTPSGDCIRASAWGYTPRLSREPPSPALLQQQLPSRPQQRPVSRQSNNEHAINAHPNAGASQSQRERERGRRMVTPSAYATPFSHTIGGDTDVDDSDDDATSARNMHTDTGVDDVEVSDLDGRELRDAIDDDAWEGVDCEEVEDEEEFRRELEYSADVDDDDDDEE